MPTTLDLIRRLRQAGIARRRRPMPRQQQPDAIRLEYGKAIIRRMLDPARELVVSRVLPLLPLLARRVDRFDADVNKTLDEVAEAFWRERFNTRDLEELARMYADRTSTFQAEQLRKQRVAALGVDVFAAEPNLEPITKAFVTENVALIKSVPNAYFDDIEKLVAREVRAGTRHEDIATKIAERYGVASSKARLIARDQVGKFYGDLNRVRQKALGVERYIWRSVRDNRVRPEHHHLDGKMFAWDKPPSEGHPGQPINCRCYPEPDFSDILNPQRAEQGLIAAANRSRPPVVKPPSAPALKSVADRVRSGDPLTPAEQAEIRKALADTLARNGFVDQDASRPGRDAFRISPGIAADGYHHWDGVLEVRGDDRHAIADALELLSHPNPQEFVKTLTPEARNMACVLLHESTHGHSPFGPRVYQGSAVGVEEVSTEVAARSMFAQITKSAPTKSYQEGIDHTITGIADGAGITKGQASLILRDASFALKRETRVSRGPDEHVRRFVDLMQISDVAKTHLYAHLTGGRW